MATGVLWARRALQDAGLADILNDHPLVPAPSALNRVFFVGPYVLRLSPDPGTRRLEYEAALTAELPAEVRYPGVVAWGRSTAGEWLVSPRMTGEALSRAWPSMDLEARRDAVTQLGHILRRLHRVTPPMTAEGPLRAPFLHVDTLECPHQLPISRILQLIERARALPNVDRGVLDGARDLAEDYAGAFSSAPDPFLVHGDPHFENVLWDGSNITAVVDYEWARAGPSDLDLDMILRFCADPAAHVAEDYAAHTIDRDYQLVPTWLRAAYPQLFSHRQLPERLAIFNLSYDVRQLLLRPPKQPPARLPANHAHQRLRRLVEGRSHLSWMDW